MFFLLICQTQNLSLPLFLLLLPPLLWLPPVTTHCDPLLLFLGHLICRDKVCFLYDKDRSLKMFAWNLYIC
ncbi:hypothetical protein GLYMA_15G179350v4 [Glycine max]|nr:hypothetical protein GLYMA_15G179350v4 [Glycine max]KAH1147728.1 hypothetical protein GYH30_042730 [Glycine max]